MGQARQGWRLRGNHPSCPQRAHGDSGGGEGLPEHGVCTRAPCGKHLARGHGTCGLRGQSEGHGGGGPGWGSTSASEEPVDHMGGEAAGAAWLCREGQGAGPWGGGGVVEAIWAARCLLFQKSRRPLGEGRAAFTGPGSGGMRGRGIGGGVGGVRGGWEEGGTGGGGGLGDGPPRSQACWRGEEGGAPAHAPSFLLGCTMGAGYDESWRPAWRRLRTRPGQRGLHGREARPGHSLQALVTSSFSVTTEAS